LVVFNPFDAAQILAQGFFVNREIRQIREKTKPFAYLAYFAVVLLSYIGTGFEAPYFMRSSLQFISIGRGSGPDK